MQMKIERTVAEALLNINAVKLQPHNPFMWASGWKSPIYCDNRKTLSFPLIRSLIKRELVAIIRAKYPQAEVIAGVATGAIAQGVLIAEALDLPFVYVRSAPKNHGMENLIEGNLNAGEKVVVVEDLISTGGSSIKAVEALRAGGGDVLGMVAIFTYNFPAATKLFANNEVKLTTLSNYQAVIKTAVEISYISKDDVATLQKWRKNPAEWGAQ